MTRDDAHESTFFWGDGNGVRRAPVHGWLLQTIASGGELDGGSVGGVMSAGAAWARPMTPYRTSFKAFGSDIPVLSAGAATLAACSDGVDNDGDGLIDFGSGPSNDPECDSPDDFAETASAVAVVGPSGGTVSTPDGGLVLDFAPGGVSGETPIGVEETSPDDPLAEIVIGPDPAAGEILRAYDVHPDGLAIAGLVQIIIVADVTALSAFGRDHLDIYLKEDTDGDAIPDSFVSIGATCVVSEPSPGFLQATCTGTVMHLSTYAMIALLPQCDDGLDNDGDGLIDFGTEPTNDPDCLELDQNSEANAPPECSFAEASPDRLWPPNHKFQSVSITDVRDPVDDVAITITAVHQDEPTDAAGDGSTCPDASGVGSDTAELRAERAGPGNGRVYRVEFSADDGREGSCSGEVQVCVPHSNKKGASCVDDGVSYDSTQCTSEVSASAELDVASSNDVAAPPASEGRCGLGFEVGPLLAGLLMMRPRRRR